MTAGKEEGSKKGQKEGKKTKGRKTFLSADKAITPFTEYLHRTKYMNLLGFSLFAMTVPPPRTFVETPGAQPAL